MCGDSRSFWYTSSALSGELISYPLMRWMTSPFSMPIDE